MPPLEAIDIIAKLRGADVSKSEKRHVSSYEVLAKKKLTARKKSDRELAEKMSRKSEGSSASTQGIDGEASSSTPREGAISFIPV